MPWACSPDQHHTGHRQAGPDHPLLLGRNARARLGGAVRTLLNGPGLVGAPDVVRLAVVVLAARTPASTGIVEIRTAELGRWLGLSASRVSSAVLPSLRRRGVVRVTTAVGERGEDRGLECAVLPLRDAHGVVGHPLALQRKEFATLLRLLEALFAPGWTHRDGSVTPAGLLGARTGRGAATDRLAILLLVLETTRNGRVRQCGGKVDTRRGRSAATVARLLGCSASGGERILNRLEGAGLVQRSRQRTASGMHQRTLLTVPAVAAAQRALGRSTRPHPSAMPPGAVLTDPSDTARGSRPPRATAKPQASEVRGSLETTAADPDVAVSLHTDHAAVVGPVSKSVADVWFSGEAPQGLPRRPGRAGARGKPLCVGTDGLHEREAPKPPHDLILTLTCVRPIWDRLGRSGARSRVVAAVRSELVAVAGVSGTASAGRVLAKRLERRLAVQGGRPVLLIQWAGFWAGACPAGLAAPTRAATKVCAWTPELAVPPATTWPPTGASCAARSPRRSQETCRPRRPRSGI